MRRECQRFSVRRSECNVGERAADAIMMTARYYFSRVRVE
jgi:hypothetical protein